MCENNRVLDIIGISQNIVSVGAELELQLEEIAAIRKLIQEFFETMKDSQFSISKNVQQRQVLKESFRKKLSLIMERVKGFEYSIGPVINKILTGNDQIVFNVLTSPNDLCWSVEGENIQVRNPK